MPLLTRTDLRITGVVSLRFSEALSGNISGVSDSHIDDSSVPEDHVIQTHFYYLLGLIGSLKCSSHGIEVAWRQIF